MAAVAEIYRALLNDPDLLTRVEVAKTTEERRRVLLDAGVDISQASPPDIKRDLQELSRARGQDSHSLPRGMATSPMLQGHNRWVDALATAAAALV